MLPEISRRCLVCGAAPRAGAQFCPQCGNNLTGRGGGAEGAGSEARPEADAGRGGAAASHAPEEAASEVADVVDEVEVARAFETWRGREAAAAEDAARPARSSAAEDAARGSDAGGAAGASAVEGVPESQGAREPLTPEPRDSQDARAGVTSEARELRGGLMSEPTAGSPSPAAGEVEGKDAPDDAAASSSKAAGAVGATRRRAAAVVKESIAPRVERVRDRSIVMLEESPGDSGLRFVLVAALMFALFVFMLVLNAFIK